MPAAISPRLFAWLHASMHHPPLGTKLYVYELETQRAGTAIDGSTLRTSHAAARPGTGGVNQPLSLRSAKRNGSCQERKCSKNSICLGEAITCLASRRRLDSCQPFLARAGPGTK